MKIEAKYAHSRIGSLLFKLCAKGSIFLVRHKGLYGTLSVTWGALTTLLGLLMLVIFGVLSLFNTNISLFTYNGNMGIYAPPRYGGGFNLGPVFVRDTSSVKSIEAHEFGHSFQNCLFGPFMLFIVDIPSAVRGWYQFIRQKLNKSNRPYDGIGFEDSATQIGLFVDNYLKKGNQ